MKIKIVPVFFLVFALIACREEDGDNVKIIIVGANDIVENSSPSQNETTDNSNEVSDPERIQPFSVVADQPVFSACSCWGFPVDVTVKLYAKGGVAPYILDGYNKTFNDSYEIPVDKKVEALTVGVRSSDGQSDDVRIEIPTCDPPPKCNSVDQPVGSDYDDNDNSDYNDNYNNNENDNNSPQPEPCPTNPSGNTPPGKCK